MSKGVVHAGMLGVRPESVRQMNGSGDKGVFFRCKDEPKVAVLALFAGTLDRLCICGEDTVGFSDRSIARFSRMLGEVWDRKPSVIAPTDWACSICSSSLQSPTVDVIKP